MSPRTSRAPTKRIDLKRDHQAVAAERDHDLTSSAKKVRFEDKEPSRRPASKKLPEIDASALDPDNPEDLAKFLGFSNFKSTKGKKVPGNNVGAADVRNKRRQYTQMLFKKSLYEIPLTKQQLFEKQEREASATQE